MEGPGGRADLPIGTVSNVLPKATELPTDEPSDTSDAWRLCPVGVSGDEAYSHTKPSHQPMTSTL